VWDITAWKRAASMAAAGNHFGGGQYHFQPRVVFALKVKLKGSSMEDGLEAAWNSVLSAASYAISLFTHP